jgi:cytochrome c-type biogenesis protein CcmH
MSLWFQSRTPRRPGWPGRWPALLLLVVLAAGPALAIDTEGDLADPEQQAIYESITREVRCLVCQNQTIADSTAPLAMDLRREIRTLIESGRSEAEVKDFLLARYGDFVLYRPRFTGSTALLWLAPGLLLVLGGFALWRVVRHRARLPIPPEDSPLP